MKDFPLGIFFSQGKNLLLIMYEINKLYLLDYFFRFLEFPWLSL